MSALIFYNLQKQEEERDKKVLEVMGDTPEARAKIEELHKLNNMSYCEFGKALCDAMITTLSCYRAKDLYEGLENTTSYNKDVALIIGWGVAAIVCLIRLIINWNREGKYRKEESALEDSILKKSAK